MKTATCSRVVGEKSWGRVVRCQKPAAFRTKKLDAMPHQESDFAQPLCEDHAQEYVRKFVRDFNGVGQWGIVRLRDSASFDLERPAVISEEHLISKGQGDQAERDREARWADYRRRIFGP